MLRGAAVSLVASALIWPLKCERQIAALFEPGWSCELAFRPRARTITKIELDHPAEATLPEGVKHTL